MEITSNRGEDFFGLKLAGRFDGNWAPHVGSAIEEAIRGGHRQIELDLSGVNYISSAGVRILFKYHRTLSTARGNLRIVGRKKDLINRGGEKISAEEVENLILMHPAVQNVACVPMPDANMGEKMCAFVILKTGQSLGLKELVAFLTTKEIAKFKLPERLEELADFPVSTFGKVSKKALGEIVAAKLLTE